MVITQGLQKFADRCVTMALSSEHNVDKALWLTLAQSWVQLDEQVAHVSVGRRISKWDRRPVLPRINCTELSL